MLRAGIRVACSSVPGRGHDRNGREGQDKVFSLRLGKRTALAALADGAGSAPFSHIGAEESLRILGRLLKERKDDVDFTDEVFWRSLVRDVRAELLRFSVQENIDFRALASTLLFVCCAFRRKVVRYCSGHIGDGVIAISENGQAKVLSHPFNGEYANSTVFLTSGDMEKNLRLALGEAKGNTGFLLMSDGVAHSLYHKKSGTVAPACQKILSWSNQFPSRKVTEILTLNLKTVFRQMTQDDCSMALLNITGMNMVKRGKARR